jgi:hypothetical protein
MSPTTSKRSTIALVAIATSAESAPNSSRLLTAELVSTEIWDLHLERVSKRRLEHANTSPSTPFQPLLEFGTTIAEIVLGLVTFILPSCFVWTFTTSWRKTTHATRVTKRSLRAATVPQ